MSKKYLSLEEAAQMLSISTEELVRMREKGEVRGFADRGTWKFKVDDIQGLARSRQADSNPEVPLFTGDEQDEQPTMISGGLDSDSDTNLLEDDDFINPLADSDSDVRLVGGPDVGVGFDSDSDVQLTGAEFDDADDDMLGTQPEILLGEGSDSDVQVMRPDSDSDVKLTGSSDSDSDVKLVSPNDASDSDVRLLDEPSRLDPDSEMSISSEDLSGTLAMDLVDEGNDSDVKILGDDDDVMLISDDDDAEAIDLSPDSSSQGSVLADESGISLAGDSSLMLGSESGISLEGPSDSGIALDADSDEGITLALDDDSGISIDAGDSGISLESVGDSGISLDGGNFSGTIPMIDAIGDDDSIPETQFEIPSLDDDDSAYDLNLDDDGSEADTGVVDLVSSAGTELDDAVFDLDEDEEYTEESYDSGSMDLDDEAFEDDEDLDVFDADEAFVDEGDGEFAPAVGGGRMVAAESEWGMGTFILLTVASVFLLLCGSVMFDLVKNTATASTPNPVSGMVLEILGGLYKG